VDKFGFVSLNSKRLLKGNIPFIFASQASQVFYCDDVASKGWLIVIKVQACNVYDISMPVKMKLKLRIILLIRS